MNQPFPVSFARAILRRNRPVYVHFAVTRRCNLRCPTCTIWRGGESAPEIDADEVGDLARVLARLGCVQVSLGGGEPIMRDDLPEIVRQFAGRGIRTRVLTNGVGLTPPVADRLFRAGATDVSLSLDSLNRDLQEDLDNTTGTYDKRLDNLLALASRPETAGSVPILNTVVSRRNFRELPRIAELAARIGFFASFIPVHLADDIGGEHRFYGRRDDLRFRPEDEPDLRAVYDALIGLKRGNGAVVNSTRFLSDSPQYLLGGQVTWPCEAGLRYLSVSPAGRVAPCHAFEGTEDVPFRDLERLVRSPPYRREVREKRARCEGCYRPCWVETRYLFTPRGFVEMARVQLRARRRRPPVNPDSVRGWIARAGGATT